MSIIESSCLINLYNVREGYHSTWIRAQPPDAHIHSDQTRVEDVLRSDLRRRRRESELFKMILKEATRAIAAAPTVLSSPKHLMNVVSSCYEAKNKNILLIFLL